MKKLKIGVTGLGECFKKCFGSILNIGITGLGFWYIERFEELDKRIELPRLEVEIVGAYDIRKERVKERGLKFLKLEELFNQANILINYAPPNTHTPYLEKSLENYLIGYTCPNHLIQKNKNMEKRFGKKR